MGLSPAHFLPRSVRGRLALLVAAIAAPALLFAVMLTFKAYQNEQASTANQLLSTARAIAGVIDGEIDDADATLKTVAASKALMDDDLPGVDAIARRALAGDERWFVLTDDHDRQLINTRGTAGGVLPSRPIDAAFRAAASARSFYVTDLEIGPLLRVPLIHIDRPVRRNGELKYILSIGVLPSTLARVTEVGRFATGSIVSVVDRKGKIVARSQNAEQFVGLSASADLVAAAASASEGVRHSITLENIPVLAAFTHADCGWSIFIGAPSSVLYSSARQLLFWAVGGSALLTAIAILMTGWILRALVRGVDSLSEDAETIGRGLMPADQPGELIETDFVARAMRRTAELLLRRTHTLEQVNLDNLELQGALSRELEAKSRSEADLERKVAERTASLREAITQMEEFSYTVSHDLRSPLRAMQGYAQILLEEYRPRLDEVGQDYLARIQRAAERMDRLTSDILSYSRVARAEVTLQPIDLDLLVRNAVGQDDEIRRSAATVTIQSPLAPAIAHEPSLRQCLSNLLTNAVKFVKIGRAPVIRVRTETRGDRVRIWVEDEGIGISPQDRSALFRLFERLPTGSHYAGTGIGLAIVRKAAEKMGGTAGVESDGISGSQFWVELAAAPPSAHPQG